MSFSFIADLNESRLFPSLSNMLKKSDKEMTQLLYLYIIGIRILMAEGETEAWAHSYVSRTLQWGTSFDLWRSNTTDLYVLLHRLHTIQFVEKTATYSLQHQDVVRWLRNIQLHVEGNIFGNNTERLFMRLDYGLKVTDSSMKAVRRQVTNWTDLGQEEQHNVLSRLIPMLRKRAPKSEILPYLNRVYRVLSKETDDADPPNSPINDIIENASAGATGAASIATSVGGLGAGFDPNGDKGIYQNLPKKKSESKPLVIRRPPIK